MKTTTLYDLPSILFGQFLETLGVKDVKELVFAQKSESDKYVCKYALLPEISKFEQPTLVLLDRRNINEKTNTVSIFLLSKPPTFNTHGEVENFEVHSKVEARADTWEEMPRFSGSWKISIGIYAHMIYHGVIEVDNIFTRLSNLYSLELAKKAYDLYLNPSYNWVVICKKTGSEITALKVKKAGVEIPFEEKKIEGKENVFLRSLISKAKLETLRVKGLKFPE